MSQVNRQEIELTDQDQIIVNYQGRLVFSLSFLRMAGEIGQTVMVLGGGCAFSQLPPVVLYETDAKPTVQKMKG